jgi:predicted GNAT superfamily acetyltransferase
VESIYIKRLEQLNQMHIAVELQKIYWGVSSESLVHARTLLTVVNTGGHVLVALDGERAVGILIGFLATTAKVYEKVIENNLALFSKRMVVLPEYRGHGIGAQLKWSQRDIAIQQGIQRIIWTYDPLLAANAYLNIHKLGCVTTTYLENPYGTDDSIGLVVLGSSDRLQVEWLVDAPHVTELANGRTGNMGRYVDSNGIISNSPSETNYGELDVVEESGRYQLLSIPHDFVTLTKTQPDSAKMWRELTRTKFQSLFNLGYIVIDFIRGENEIVYYVLARHEQS